MNLYVVGACIGRDNREYGEQQQPQSPRRHDTRNPVEVTLPVKSLLRFKCVCNSWSSLISKQHFAKSHFNQAPSHRFLYISLLWRCNACSIDIDAPLHHYSLVPLPYINIGGQSIKSPFQFRGSCRGCVLLDHHCFQILILWNPSTGAQKSLPYPLTASKIHYGSSLGYDKATDDYFVVVTSKRSNEADLAIYLEIFSMRTSSWEEIMLQQYTPFPYRGPLYDICKKDGVFFNGVVHWKPQDLVIICFDLRLRKLSEMPMPDEFPRDSFTDLMVLGGCLAAYNDNEIWVMKEYKVQSSWTKYCDVYSGFKPLCVSKAGEIIGLDNRFIVRKLVKLNDKGEALQTRKFRCYGSVLYVESLLPLP